MDYTVTVLDTGGIQNYIFGSNQLRENIGASELVHRATQHWAFEAVAAAFPDRHNILNPENPSETQPFDLNFKIEEVTGPAAEVLYAGGGNTIILFGGDNHPERAKDFVYALSRRILHEAPGLNLYAAHDTYTWQADPSLPAVIESVLKQLGQLKGELPGNLPALGLSVTAECTSTGLPANGSHPDRDKRGTLANVANRMVHAKWPAAEPATARLRDMFSAVEDASFLWTDELDRLANLTDRNDSYIAVVHADGNGMGRRIQAFNAAWQPETDKPREYIAAMRGLSQQIASTATEALTRTINALVAQLTTKEGREQYNSPYFPFRPIVFGGDDVTWVAAGPWGVSLAHRYLAELEKETITEERPGGDTQEAPPYGAAGVTIVKTHYPFSRAYVLAEKLAKSAKQQVRAVNPDKQASALDWHYTTTGLTGNLHQIRAREYRSIYGRSLLMRPILLDSQHGWRHWDNFNRLVTAFAYGWADKRNKVMALREALRGERPAVRQFDTIYTNDKLPELDGSEYGWVGDGDEARCSHFDAVELIDMFFHLPADVAEEATP